MSARITARCSACRNWARSAPTASPTRATFRAPVAAFEDATTPCEVVAKFEGNLWAADLDHSPLDVVAWHGNYAPYVYDLGALQHDRHGQLRPPGPVDLHGADLAERHPRHRQLRFRDLPAALAGGRAHLPPAVVPPQRHERVHGPGARRLRRQGRGLRAGRRLAAQLHVGARPRPGHLRQGDRRRTASRRRSRTRSPSCSRRGSSSARPASRSKPRPCSTITTPAGPASRRCSEGDWFERPNRKFIRL